MTDDYPGTWETAPLQSDTSDQTIFVTGRMDVASFRQNPKFNIRIDVSLCYESLPSGLPDAESAETLKDITDRLVTVFHKDPIAVMTGIYTGAGERNWIFYTLSTHIFQRKFNEALDDLPTLPFSITAENDPAWEEYTEMSQAVLSD